MNEAPIHQTGMHKGFLLAYALLNVFVLVLALGFGWLLAVPLRIAQGLLPQAATTTMGYLALIPAAMITVPLVIGWIPVLIAFKKTVVIFRRDAIRFKTGLIFRTEGHLSWDEIESVFVQRGPMGSLLGYGTLVLVGRAGTPFHLAFMPEFEKLRELALTLGLKQARKSEGEHRRIHSGPSPSILQPCASCGATTSAEDAEICAKSADRFANKLLCAKCRRYVP
jgi:membrane protein YdbS with pleckstrin-like domain